MEAQKKYYNSDKGRKKLMRQNEKRRNNTKYKKVVRALRNIFLHVDKLNISFLPKDLLGRNLKSSAILYFIKLFR